MLHGITYKHIFVQLSAVISTSNLSSHFTSRRTTVGACFHLASRIISIFLTMRWKKTRSSITGRLHTISHLFLMSADDQIVGCAY